MCNAGTKHTETIVTPLPQELAAVAPTGAPTGRTEFIDGSESDAVISPGQGESIPPDGDEDTPVESTKPSEEKPSSSFGYAFLIMLLTIGIALSAVWFYRKYRVRQMQYREFEVCPGCHCRCSRFSTLRCNRFAEGLSCTSCWGMCTSKLRCPLIAGVCAGTGDAWVCPVE